MSTGIGLLTGMPKPNDRSTQALFRTIQNARMYNRGGTSTTMRAACRVVCAEWHGAVEATQYPHPSLSRPRQQHWRVSEREMDIVFEWTARR